MEMLLVAFILFLILSYDNIINPANFFKEGNSYFKFLREKDFDFYVKVKYGEDADPDKLYTSRVRNMILIIISFSILYLSSLTMVSFLFIVIIGYLVFKSTYRSLKKYYKVRMTKIDLTLPYYLKTLEILIQHHTVPVALSRSVKGSPEIFRKGLQELVDKINAGDATVEPYMTFAKDYPVRDSMRMMRLLFRLGLGSQNNKKDQILMFSRTVSSLQNKAREQKYAERLAVMESKTMIMLGVTGGLTMMVLMMSLMQLM